MGMAGRRRPVGRTFRRVGAVVGLLAAAVAMPPGPTAHADLPDPSSYDVAPAVDVHPSPNVLETTLVARPATVDVGGGVEANMWTYNGTVPGPQLRLAVGDTVIVHFRNELPEPSGIHWHGIELPNASDGSSLTENRVPPGGSFLYKFVVPRPGIFWYHPHHSPTNQVFRGLYGSLIVDDPHDGTLVANGVLPDRAHTKTLMLSDTTVCKEPGQNDTRTYDPSLPWAGGGPLPNQLGPRPSDLCDTPMDQHGNSIVTEGGQPIPLSEGEIPNIQRATAGRMIEGQAVLTNGRNVGGRGGSPEAPGALAAGASALDLAAGQGLRLQAINASTIRYVRLRLTDTAGRQIDLHRVGGEGGLLDKARIEGGAIGVASATPVRFDTKSARGEIVLGPSDRADLVVAVPRDAPIGVATLWTLDISRTGQGYSNLPSVPVAHINVTPPTDATYTTAEGAALRTHPSVMDPVEVLGPQGPLPDRSGSIHPLLDPATFSPPKPGTANEEIKLDVGVRTEARIDNAAGRHDADSVDYSAIPHAASTRYAKVGDVLELTVTNVTGAHHIFHLHGFSFQPVAYEKLVGSGAIALNSTWGDYVFDYHEFVDSIDVPESYRLRFRVRLDERPLTDGATPGGAAGRWVLHCHIFPHASFGMQAELVVVQADGNEKPLVNTDATDVSVAEGSTATTTGTFVDPDGDAVALSASAGTVTDVGNGRWSWRQDGVVGGDRLVYVTATDSKGLRSQIAFHVKVAAVAPTVTITSPASGSAVAKGSAVTVTAAVQDPGGLAGVTCRFDWDDGNGLGAAVTPVAGSCAESRTFTSAGVSTVRVVGSDSSGATGSATTLVIVYDRNAGPATGSGTVASPAGAYTANPTSSGAAAFDGNVQYRNGSLVPTGNLRFVLPSGPFDLRATSFDWLVVAGSKAQVKGTGIVGGATGYRFLLTVADGTPDKLRLKVWDNHGSVVYDNVTGAPDDIDTAAPAPVQSGDVVIRS